MALIKCRECGKEISDQAQSCPNCAVPLKKPSEKRKGMGIGTAIVIIIVVIIIASYATQDARKVTKTNNKNSSKSQKIEREIEEAPDITEYIVNTPTLNVRSEPNDRASIIKKLKVGDMVYVADQAKTRKGVWMPVKESYSGENMGFVDSSYLINRHDLKDAKNRLEIVNFNWSNDYGLAKFKVTLKNTSPWDIKDVQFALVYFAPSGTIVDQGKETAYEIIPAGSTKTVTLQELGSTKSEKASVSVYDAKWAYEPGKRNLDW